MVVYKIFAGPVEGEALLFLCFTQNQNVFIFPANGSSKFGENTVFF
jgi:hypothetical protein